MSSAFGGVGLDATVAGSGFPSMNAGYRSFGSYANPHHSIALRDIPTNLKQVMRLTRWYYNSDSLLGAIVDKMAEYPITQLLISEKTNYDLSASTRARWDYLLNVVLNMRQVMIDINVDKMVYGNSFHYMYYPFVRYCTCKSCGYRAPIGSFEEIRTKVVTNDRVGFTFTVTSICPTCSRGGRAQREFTIEDRKSESRANMKFVRMSPTRMQLAYNPSTGVRQWYWVPPSRLRDGLLSGDRTVTDSTEMAVLEAVHKDRRIKMNPARLWVAQTANQPDLWEGWGVPPLFRVLEDVYYYKILRRANEALAQEHITPARFISPSGTGDVSPQRTMNLSDWQSRIRGELYRLKQDPNHIIITPIPINIEQMGGQARVMMVAPEIEAAARVIAAGIGCPIELIWGGLNWSGASVSLRVLENHFINMREDCERLLGFFVPKMANYFQMTPVEVKLAEFKMADDVQQQGNAINLMLQGYLSRASVVGEMGYDPNDEFDKLEKEHKRLNQITMQDNVAASHMNTVIQALEAKAQVMLQYEIAHLQTQLQVSEERERLQALNAHVESLHKKGYATPLEFDQSAQILQGLDPQMSQMILQQWSQSMPNVVALLSQRINAQQAQQTTAQQATANAQGAQSAGAAQDTSMTTAQGPYSGGDAPDSSQGAANPNSLPSARPPRSGPATAQV